MRISKEKLEKSTFDELQEICHKLFLECRDIQDKYRELVECLPLAEPINAQGETTSTWNATQQTLLLEWNLELLKYPEHAQYRHLKMLSELNHMVSKLQVPEPGEDHQAEKQIVIEFIVKLAKYGEEIENYIVHKVYDEIGKQAPVIYVPRPPRRPNVASLIR